MAKILFVTETEIKDGSPMSTNVDIKLLSDSVGYAQDAYVQDILGTDLYKHLMDAFEGGTLTAKEEDLVDLIKPMLVYRGVEQSLPFVQTQIRGKGTMHLESNSSQQADIEYMRYLRDELKGRAQFLTERIINFLCKNIADFPLYKESETDISPSTKNGYNDCDLYLDSWNDCSCGKKSCNCN